MSSQLERVDKGFWGTLKRFTMSSKDRANLVNRSVVDYKPCNIDAFFEPSHGVFNALISGGNPELRNSGMVAQAICAVQNGFPVIVLHERNRQLEQLLKTTFQPSKKYKEIGSSTPCFEPFFGLSDLEISNQIIEIAPKEYDIKYNARYYVDAISAFLRASGKNLSFKMFSTCPHPLIFDKVDDLEAQGKISAPEAQEIKSKLMMGQSEIYKLDTLFANLKMEMEPFMYVSKRGFHPMNIITALKTGAVLCLDIASVTNKIFFNILIYQLKLALTKGLQYELIIDSIPLNSNEAYSTYIKSLSDTVCRTIATDDFYSMVGSDEKTFSAIVGSSPTVILMNHSSGQSAIKWAEVFGQYDKLEESYSTSRGGSRMTPISILSSPNYSRTVSVNKNREYIIKPETITRMINGEAYVMNPAQGEVAHLVLTG